MASTAGPWREAFMIADALKQLANQTLKPFDLVLTRYSHLQHLVESNSKATGDLNFLLKLPEEYTSLLLRHLRKSRSQLRQDLFVLSELCFKTNGFFVEFGATNGVDLNNTHLLETTFQWSGVLAEPA